MKHTFKAYFFSFMLHTAILFLFFLLQGRVFYESKKIIEIDLSSVEFQKTSLEERREPPERVKVKERMEKTELKSKSERVVKGIVQESKLERLKEQTVHAKTEQEARKTIQQENGVNNIQGSPLSHTGTQNAAYQSQGGEEVAEGRSASATKATKSQGSQAETSETKTASAELQREMYLKEKLSIIAQIVQKNINYPLLARRMGWEGKVLLSIHIGEDGAIKEVRIVESSGHEILDRNAVETVKRVAELFPKPPVEVVVRLPVRYRLE